MSNIDIETTASIFENWKSVIVFITIVLAGGNYISGVIQDIDSNRVYIQSANYKIEQIIDDEEELKGVVRDIDISLKLLEQHSNHILEKVEDTNRKLEDMEDNK